MKKSLFILLLTAALVFSFTAGASADAVVSLGTAPAGQPFSQVLSDADNALFLTLYDANADGVPDYSLPAGLTIEPAIDEETATLKYYIKGTPLVAGNYTFVLCATFLDGSSSLLNCSISISPSAPILSISEDHVCKSGDTVAISCYASSVDGGTLLYQWYSNVGRTTEGGTLIGGANEATLNVLATTPDDTYYYCLVTNNNNGLVTSGFSPVAKVTVTAAPTVVSFAVSKTPEKLKYYTGEQIDPAGMEFSVTYSDGTSAILTDFTDVTFTPEKFDAVGFQSVSAEYMGKTIAFPVQVEEYKDQIEIVRMPSKLRYKVGERLETDGLTLRVISRDGYTDVTSGFTCSPTTMTRTGEQTITVIYGNGESSTFTVYVEAANTDVRIEIISLPSKLNYKTGEALDTAGLTLRVWTGDDYKDYTAGFICEPTVFQTAGSNQIVTVRYGNNSASYFVSVTEAEPAATSTPAPSAAVTPVPTIKVNPNGSGSSSKGQKSSAPTAVIIIAIVIALAALAGAVTYIYLLRRNRQSGRDYSEYEKEVYGEDFTDTKPKAAPVKPDAPVNSSVKAGPGTVHQPGVEPDKKDYFEGLFDDK